MPSYLNTLTNFNLSFYYAELYHILIHWPELYPILTHWPELYPILIHWPELYSILMHWSELYPILIDWAELYPILIHWVELYVILKRCRNIPYLKTWPGTLLFSGHELAATAYLNTWRVPNDPHRISSGICYFYYN